MENNFDDAARAAKLMDEAAQSVLDSDLLAYAWVATAILALVGMTGASV